MSGKYNLLTMKEIEQIPWNGFNVVSTFSGGGGSCLGYRMAGYRVLWASEFVEEAQRTYRINHPQTYLDCRDIRTVTAESILRKTGLKIGDLDLLDGSPPCCSFSTAGSRERGWGKERAYSDGKKQRTDDLFSEYIRLLNGLQPKTFVAENVSGLAKGKARGFFKKYIAEMRRCGYQVSACLINAKYLGVPESRERVIFIGVRNDLHIAPVFPTPLPYQISLGEALKGVANSEEEEMRLLDEAKKYEWGRKLTKMPKNPPKSESGSKYYNGSYFNLKRESMYVPCSTICQMNGLSSAGGNCHPWKDRKFTIAELKRITSIPDDFVLTGDYRQQWERLGRMVPPIMMFHISKTIEEEILCKI